MKKMSGVNLDTYETMMTKAIRHFWSARKLAQQKQFDRGIKDQGNRQGVTAGKNMDGFIEMVCSLVKDNGIPDADILVNGRASLTLPGFFKPTKNWDLLIISQQQLIAAIEFKSQVGPSFGNNFNNRVEEAIGNAIDLKTAYREGCFLHSPKPFVGYFFVLEESENSTSPVSFKSPHFPVISEFLNTSYAERYNILCKKLVLEQHYDAAALVLTPPAGAKKGIYRTVSKETSCLRFVSTLAGRVVAIAAEL